MNRQSCSAEIPFDEPLDKVVFDITEESIIARFIPPIGHQIFIMIMHNKGMMMQK